MIRACTAFAGNRRIASGPPLEVALAASEVAAATDHAPILVFDDDTGRTVGLDLRGTPDEIRARLSPPEPPGDRSGPGRPKLGVVPKEVTLLPRHWAWLSAQRGGASATLRRLVDEARKSGEHGDRVRRAQDATYRFMSAIGGDLPGFEEAIRALYRADRERFEVEVAGWPIDLRDHAARLATSAFEDVSDSPDADADAAETNGR